MEVELLQTCVMPDSGLMKSDMFGIMKGTPKREWLNDLQEWYNKDMYSIYKEAQNGDRWLTVVRLAVDTSGH